MFYYSTGIHPWYINDKTYQQDLITMKIASQQNNVLAIGECGLDRLCDTDFKLQQKVFIEQIIWANEIAKPLIIHCVRAHREALSLLKEHNRTSPFIFHGFNKNEEVANEILNAGGMLSFGKWVLKPESEKLIAKLSAGTFFLETDDSDNSIETIYKHVAKIKNLTVEQLNHQIQHNFKRIFKTNF